MPTRNVVLTDRQEKFIGDLVAEGRYQNASEAVRDALRLLAERIEDRRAALEGIRAGVLEGLAQEARGEFAEGAAEDVIRRAFAQARASSPP